MYCQRLTPHKLKLQLLRSELCGWGQSGSIVCKDSRLCTCGAVIMRHTEVTADFLLAFALAIAGGHGDIASNKRVGLHAFNH